MLVGLAVLHQADVGDIIGYPFVIVYDPVVRSESLAQFVAQKLRRGGNLSICRDAYQKR
jgi:hypothetical protein